LRMLFRTIFEQFFHHFSKKIFKKFFKKFSNIFSNIFFEQFFRTTVWTETSAPIYEMPLKPVTPLPVSLTQRVSMKNKLNST
jgi:hypothetical protein